MSNPTSRPLTKAMLYEHALSIVDAEGLGALTMRRLAAEVGVKAPSLYNHVTSKEELVAGALQVMRSQFRTPTPAPEDWKTLMAAIFSEYGRILTAHPNMMPLAGRRLPGEQDSGLAYLTGQGFTTDQAVELWQSLLALTVGFAMFTSGHTATDTHGLPENLSSRAHDWRDQTRHRALMAIMDTYADEPAPLNPPQPTEAPVSRSNTTAHRSPNDSPPHP